MKSDEVSRETERSRSKLAPQRAILGTVVALAVFLVGLYQAGIPEPRWAVIATSIALGGSIALVVVSAGELVIERTSRSPRTIRMIVVFVLIPAAFLLAFGLVEGGSTTPARESPYKRIFNNYGDALDAAFDKLRSGGARAKRVIDQHRTRVVEAEAIEELGAAFRRAERALRRVRVPAADAGLNWQLARTFGAIGNAYTRLAAAMDRGKRGMYSQARRDVERETSLLRGLEKRLESRHYPIVLPQ